MLTNAGGRRFLLTLGAGVASTVLVWFAKISGEVYASVVIATVGAFIAGNVTQKVKAPQPEEGG